MVKKLLITKIKNSYFSALLDEDNRLVDMSVDDVRCDSILDNIYIGRVANVMHNIHASFVEFRQQEMGFIPDILKPGQKIMVQVIKDSFKGKEPVLSAEPVITGKYVILKAKHTGIHFSYKFKNREKKEQLKKSFEEQNIDDCAFIIRTKAMYVENEVIEAELKSMYENYKKMLEDSETKKVFSVLYKAPTSYIQYIINSRKDELTQIVTDNKEIYDNLHSYLRTFESGEEYKLKFYEDDIVPLTVLYNLSGQLSHALSRKVHLKSGAYLVIDCTEALTVIDVNSGSDSSGGSTSEEYLKINLEAAEEAARQIRLRNLSGIILIDFINMANLNTKNVLLESFKKMLDKDPMGPNVVDMTKLGIVEITRKRAKKPIAELMGQDFFDK